MLSSFSRVIMFLTSYVPLYLIFLINFLFRVEFNITNLRLLDKSILGLVIFLLVIPSILLFFIFKLAEDSYEDVSVNSIDRSNTEVLNYILAYIVPFVSTDFLALNELITFMIFFFIIGLIYVKNKMIHINPFLYLVGYNIYVINKTSTLISRKSYTQLYTLDSDLRVSEISSGIYLDVSE